VQQLGSWLGQYAPLRAAVRVLSLLWHFAVPTGSMAALQPLLQQLHVLELEFEWEVLVVWSIGELCQAVDCRCPCSMQYEASVLCDCHIVTTYDFLRAHLQWQRTC
jgi:hypothetical protein